MQSNLRNAQPDGGLVESNLLPDGLQLLHPAVQDGFDLLGTRHPVLHPSSRLWTEQSARSAVLNSVGNLKLSNPNANKHSIAIST